MRERDHAYDVALGHVTAELEVAMPDGGPYLAWRWDGPGRDTDTGEVVAVTICGTIASWTHGKDVAAANAEVARAWWHDRVNAVELTSGFYFHTGTGPEGVG